VLLFQPRSVFVDTITNKVIGREARNQVRKRLETWDEIPAHPDLGFYGDPGNLEWKQYFLDDANLPVDDRCPFLKRQREKAAPAHDSHTHWHPRAPATPESLFAPHVTRHGTEHRHQTEAEHEREHREHGEE
jgi:hypothetical protein